MNALRALLLATPPALALLACTFEPGGPEYADIGLRTVDAFNVELRRDCFPLPVLPGGAVDDELALAPGLGAHVHTEQDFAEVALSGTNNPAATRITVPKSSLKNGYSKTFNVTTTSGAGYSVVVLSPCAPMPDGGT